MSSELYPDILNATTDAIVVYDNDGKVLYANAAFTSVFGWTFQEVQGRRIPYVPESEAETTAAIIAQVVGGSLSCSNFETLRLTKDGRLLNISISASCFSEKNGLPAGMIVILRDITEKKMSEETLRQSEKNYRAIFNAVEDAILIHDISTGKIVDVNERFSRLYGYSRHEAMNSEVSMLTVDDHAFSASKALEKIKRAAEGQAQRFEWLARNREGTSFWVEVTLRRVELGNGPQVLASVRDISERKKAEEILLHSELIKAAADLASGVAHNFNNLLQKMLACGQSALLKLDSGDMEATRELLNEITLNSKNGSETVKRLQSFAQLRSDVTENAETDFDLSNAVKDAVDMSELLCRTLAVKNGIYIRTRTDLTENLMVTGRSNDLFEVSLNLLRNAIETSPHGGLVTVRTHSRDGFAILEVEDNGTGITTEDLGRIFDPFFTTKGMQSTGMGLAAAYGIITSHGGTISVDTEVGCGSKFTVSLPLASSTRDKSRNHFVTLDRDSHLRMLVIDDDENLLALFEDALTSFGQRVHTASSGTAALEILVKESFDLITCDLGMPRMNGWEVGKRVKALFESNGKIKPPFVLLTGWGGQTSERDKMIESGVDLVLEKPIDMIELIEKANDLVRKTMAN